MSVLQKVICSLKFKLLLVNTGIFWTISTCTIKLKIKICLRFRWKNIYFNDHILVTAVVAFLIITLTLSFQEVYFKLIKYTRTHTTNQLKSYVRWELYNVVESMGMPFSVHKEKWSTETNVIAKLKPKNESCCTYLFFIFRTFFKSPYRNN